MKERMKERQTERMTERKTDRKKERKKKKYKIDSKGDIPQTILSCVMRPIILVVDSAVLRYARAQPEIQRLSVWLQ